MGGGGITTKCPMSVNIIHKNALYYRQLVWWEKLIQRILVNGIEGLLMTINCFMVINAHMYMHTVFSMNTVVNLPVQVNTRKNLD